MRASSCLRELITILEAHNLRSRFLRKPLYLRFISLSLELARRWRLEEEHLKELERASEWLTIRSRTLLMPPFDILRTINLPIAPGEASLIESPKMGTALMLMTAWNLWVTPMSVLMELIWSEWREKALGMEEIATWAEEIAMWLRYRREMKVAEPIREWILQVVPRDVSLWCERFREAVAQLSSAEVSLIRTLLRLRRGLRRHPVRSCTACSNRVLKVVALRLRGRGGRSIYLCRSCSLEVVRGSAKVIGRVLRRASRAFSREALIEEVRDALRHNLSSPPTLQLKVSDSSK